MVAAHPIPASPCRRRAACTLWTDALLLVTLFSTTVASLAEACFLPFLRLDPYEVTGLLSWSLWVAAPLPALLWEGLLGGRLGRLRAVPHVCGFNLLDDLHRSCNQMHVNGAALCTPTENCLRSSKFCGHPLLGERHTNPDRIIR